jgi:ATP-binding cassette subfamily B protein
MLDATPITPSLAPFAWPAGQLGAALVGLARQGGLRPLAVEPPTPPNNLAQANEETIGRWLEAAANWLGIEMETMALPYIQVAGQLRQAGPALYWLPPVKEGVEPGFLAVLKSQGQKVWLLTPAATIERVPLTTIRAALCRPLEEPLLLEVDGLLQEAGVPQRRIERARQAILQERLSHTFPGYYWRLHPAPGAPFWSQLRRSGTLAYMAAFIAAHTLYNGLWLLSWGVIGLGALSGRIDPGWLAAWVLLLLTLVPLRMAVTWLQGLLTVSAGSALKKRLLYGAMRLEPDEIRHQGAGQLLGRVIESEAIEWLALSGGFLGLVAAVELIMAGFVLAAGAAGGLHVLLLVGWTMLNLFLGWRYYQQHRDLTRMRRDMTHDLVEQMVGYRTRLIQEQRSRWHNREDEALGHYLEASGAVDQTAALLMALISRGWLALGITALAPAFISNGATPEQIAIGLGGVISAYLAFRKFSSSSTRVVSAVIAWQQVSLLFRAAARPEETGIPAFAAVPVAPQTGVPLLSVDGLTFRYHGRGETVLRQCKLDINSGDRLLLEGPSGGGKSTLAALLTGVRRPESGLLLAQGLDRATLGATGWRRRVAAAPQFHENHVFIGTFAFNLLMSRRWPARPADLEEAETLCRQLGLGELLNRMPAGLLQMVGETGWQLSHGERSRVYIARALLQGSDLVILDESFAALDPETLQQVMACVTNRAATLLVIAHP